MVVLNHLAVIGEGPTSEGAFHVRETVLVEGLSKSSRGTKYVFVEVL
jgi:hypothetical protein